MSEFIAVPQRETYPLVSSDDTLVMVFRDHITLAARPVLFVKALGDAEVRVDSSRNLDARTGIRVVDFSNGSGDTVTVTVDGTATVLTDGVEFTAAISDAETAIRIADAINTAAIGVTASVEQNGVDVFVAPGAGVTALTIATGDATAWSPAPLTIFGAPTALTTQSTLSINLPVGTFDPINKVAYLRVLSGRVSADLRSPVPVRTYFEQPSTLSPTTGGSGGWPTAPDLPPA